MAVGGTGADAGIDDAAAGARPTRGVDGDDLQPPGGGDPGQETVGGDRHPLQDAVADHHQRPPAGPQAMAGSGRETGAVVEIAGRIIGPAAPAIEALAGVAAGDPGQGGAELAIGRRWHQRDGIQVPGVLPVAAEVQLLEALQVARRMGEAQPVELRARVAVVVVVVEIGRRGDDEVHAALPQPAVVFQEGSLEDARVGTPGPGAALPIPGGIAGHAQHGLGQPFHEREVLHPGAPGGRPAAQAGLVGIVRALDHDGGEGETEDGGRLRFLSGDEVEGQQHLGEHPGAVEGRAGAEAGRRRAVGGAALARRLLAEGGEGLRRPPQARGAGAVGRQLGARSQDGIGVDLEAHRLVAHQIGLDQRGADACEGIQHRAGLAHETGQRVGDEAPGEAGDPGHPAVDGRIAVGREGGIAKGRRRAGLCRRLPARIADVGGGLHRHRAFPGMAAGYRVPARPSKVRWAPASPSWVLARSWARWQGMKPWHGCRTRWRW